MVITHQLILFYFFNKVISCFIYIFKSKFLPYVFFNHIFKVIMYFLLNQEVLIWQLILFLKIFFHLYFRMQLIERTNVFLQKCIFYNFQYLPETMENIFFHLNLKEKINLYNLANFYLLA